MQVAEHDHDRSVIVRGAGVLDPASGQIARGAEVELRAGEVVRVGERRLADAGAARVIDLGALTLMPGLIDAHTHFWGVDSTRFDRFYLDGDAERALWSVRDARDTVRAGFTTVRSLGSFVDLPLREAISSGLVEGPRVVGAGPFMMSRGGTWDNFALPRELMERQGVFADGEAECRALARDRVRAGADTLKVGVSAGRRGDWDEAWGDDPWRLRVAFEERELRAITEVAHEAGLSVAAHAIGDAAVRRALDGGVDVIEHGHAISDDTRRRLVDQDTPVVSTLSAQRYRITHGPGLGFAPEATAVARRHHEEQVRSMQRSLELGVRYALGTDFIGPPGWPHGENATEYLLAHELVGMSPAEVLRAGLHEGARVLGLDGRVGTLAVGAAADVIGVDGDPLQDLSALRRVRFVMAAGRVVRAPGADGATDAARQES